MKNEVIYWESNAENSITVYLPRRLKIREIHIHYGTKTVKIVKS